MRILAIRGSNLASLAEPFEIDLTVPPLAGTGLFAITGETGAGKSTILDALCLGLYGTYPRAQVSGSEVIRDSSGEEIRATNPRNILRRGAASGFAEVDFIGRDARAYRARWQVRRARGKADGKLQDYERTLVLRDDGTAIAARKGEVGDAVEALTGLTFDQFRRTVLLAQGEFDTLLMADDSQRAELLEKITGTEVYARISKRVYRTARDKEKDVAALAQRHGDIGILEDAARTALEAQANAIEATLTTQRATDAELTARLQRGEDFARAQNLLAQARDALTEATAAHQNAAGERTRLARLEAAVPLRATAAAVESAERRARNAELAHTAAAEALAASAAHDTALEVKSHQLAETQRAADAHVAHFTPLWRAAQDLDNKVLSAQGEQAAADRVARAASAAAQTAATEHEATRAAWQSKQEARDGLKAELATRAAHAPFADLDGVLMRSLKAYVEQAERRAEEREKFAEAAARAKSDTHRLTAAQTRVGEARKTRDALTARLSPRREALATMDERAWTARSTALAAARENLFAAIAIAERFETARRRADRADETAREAQGREAAAQNLIEAATREEAEAQGALAALSSMSDLAEATLSESAARLRMTLVDDEACPVCGAQDHPYAAHGLDHALLAGIQARRTAADAQLVASRERILIAREARTAAAGTHKRAVEDQTDAAREIAQARTAFLDLRPALEAAAQALDGRAAVPLILDPEAPERLAICARAVSDAQSEIARQLEQARVLRSELDLLQQQHAAASTAMEDVQSDIQALSTAASAAAAALEGQRLRLGELDMDISKLARELEAPLAAADIPLSDLDARPEHALRRVTALGRTYAELAARATTLDGEIHALAPQIAAADQKRTAAAAHDTQAAIQLEQRMKTLAALQRERAALLDGEPTDQHRTRFMKAAKAAQDACAAATLDRHKAVAAKVRCEAAEQHAEQELIAARTAQQSAAQAFAAACAAIALAPDVVRNLLAESHEAIHALRTELAALERALGDASRDVATRTSDVERHLAEGNDSIDLAAVRTEAAALREAIDAQISARATIIAQLAQDTHARERAAHLAAEIEAAKADLGVWQDLDAAIGSANGDAFRRFAQGITLDQLVGLANDKLAALAPRYALGRSEGSDLALHVIDGDMGAEVRALRSLSGGERFLFSLALALALSELEGHKASVDTLFIDEGFGALDAETLDVAIDALEQLQSQGRKVGVITHVAAMIDRIAVQVRVERRGGGRSALRLVGGDVPTPAATAPAAPTTRNRPIKAARV